MTAMGVERFVVTLRHAAEGKMEERYWSKGDVMHSMAWLKRMNARGYDVLIRPDGAHGLVLLEGLTKAQLDTLHQRGFGPALVVDADRAHYQAWIKLSLAPITERTQEHAGRALRKELGLSTGSEGSPKDGRLVGLTNHSVKLQSNVHPYGLLIEAVGRVAPAASGYLKQVEKDDERKRQLSLNKINIKPPGRSR